MMPEQIRLRLALALMILALMLNGCARDPMVGITNDVGAPIAEVSTDPLSPEQQMKLDRADAASARAQWAEAESILAPLVASRPGEPDLKARLAWVRQQQGDRAGASQLYREALAGNPDNLMARNNLALLLQQDGDFEAAATLLRQGIERGLDAPELHFNLAVLSELYLLDLEAALHHYRAYQSSIGEDNDDVKGWIADLERRLK